MTELENENPQEVYQKASEYWSTKDSNVNGMLGGFEKLHTPDINNSKKFINLLKQKSLLTNFERTIDCGSGIGRVTKHLLVPFFEQIDMVDVTEKFIEESKAYLGEAETKIGQRFVSGLQDFVPQEGYYDCIWVQWVAIYLTDEDFENFFERCKKGLRSNGCIVVKENIASTEKKDYDSEDASWTRPRSMMIKLFEKAGLKVALERKQLHFPKGFYEVRMFALVPTEDAKKK